MKSLILVNIFTIFLAFLAINVVDAKKNEVEPELVKEYLFVV